MVCFSNVESDAALKKYIFSGAQENMKAVEEKHPRGLPSLSEGEALCSPNKMMKRSLLIDHCNSFKVSRSQLILKLSSIRDNFILAANLKFKV